MPILRRKSLNKLEKIAKNKIVHLEAQDDTLSLYEDSSVDNLLFDYDTLNLQSLLRFDDA